MSREGRANLAIGAAVLTALATAPAGLQTPLQAIESLSPGEQSLLDPAEPQTQALPPVGQVESGAFQVQALQPEASLPLAVPSRRVKPEPAGAELAARRNKQHLRPRVYTVVAGDNPWTIAQRYGVPYEFFLEFNGLTATDFIFPGQELLVPSAVAVASRQAVHRPQGPEQPAPEQQVALEPRLTVSRGGGRAARELHLDELIATTPFARWPADGEVTDRFGWRLHPIRGIYHLHDGLDIASSAGTAIYAVAPGTVSFAGWQDGYGLLVEIDHGNGIVTRYAHCSRLLKAMGEAVSDGELIARMGATGMATGSHLHFSVKVGGTWVDPEDYLP